MTPEEKLLALIQQDKRQAGSLTPQEKLLALLEQDKKKPEPSVPVPPAVVAPVAPVPLAKPAPLAPVPVAARPVPVAVPVPVAAPVPVVAKPQPVVAAPPASAPVKPPLVVVAPPVMIKSVPIEVTPPVVVRQPAPVVVPSEPTPQVTLPSGVPQPLLFPTIRVSGVTITNRVLAAVVLLLIGVVFYSVAGTQRGIYEEIRRQINGAGEMSVPPLVISEETVPSVDIFLDKVSKRNFFAPIMAEKDTAGAAVPATVGLTKDLKLVAVSVDAATASESMAIIKSKADSKTYFVKIGENVGDTGFVLFKVLADRLVLKKGKQEFELK